MTAAVSLSPTVAIAAPAAIRVMVVDDAIVVRGLVSRWIEDEPDLVLVASLRNGREAVDHVERADPDVVILDVDMPELDGVSALPLLLARRPGLVVIMASTLTRRNAEISLRALALGAADYISKPGSAREVTTSVEFRRELVLKVRAFGACVARNASPDAGSVDTPHRATAPHGEASLVPTVAPGTISLRPFSAAVPRVVVIGSSTGGPQALEAVVSQLGPVLARVPVLVTQHMPAMFTTILAEHLSRVSGQDVHEARDGEPIRAGSIYLAPGGRHMRVRRQGGPVIALDDGAPVHFCRPAVDPLFASAAALWGSATLGVILTGMGHDGTQGAADVVGAGGSVIAQDEATSVIWGMPGSVAQAGLCAAVLPLREVAPGISRLCFGARP